MSISQAEYDKGLSPNGETLNKTAPEVKYRDWTNKRTGVVERVPFGIDRLSPLPLAGRDRSRQFFARIESYEPERVGWARFCPEGVLAPFGCAHAVSRIAYRVGKPRKTFGRAPG